MNAEVFKLLADKLRPLADASIVFYNADQKADVDAHLKDGKAWIKLYGPSQDSEGAVLEGYLVLIDAGAKNMETARRASEKVRTTLRSTLRKPNGFHLRRAVLLNEDNFYRFQLAYRLIHRPAGGN